MRRNEGFENWDWFDGLMLGSIVLLSAATGAVVLFRAFPDPAIAGFGAMLQFGKIAQLFVLLTCSLPIVIRIGGIAFIVVVQVLIELAAFAFMAVQTAPASKFVAAMLVVIDPLTLLVFCAMIATLRRQAGAR